MDYNSLVAEVANMMPIQVTDPNFLTMVPGMIEYAEGRIYRELDPLRVQITDSTTLASSGVRNFTVPSATGTFITVDNINIITPSSVAPSVGSRVQLTPVSRDFIDIAYPSGQNATGTPEFWAMASDTQVIFGPSPDLPYPVEVIGIQRPTALSSLNTTTFLTTYIPDVMFAACMIYASGFMRDFGAQGADNPQMSISWESQYKQLFQSAQVEQLRAKYQSQGWTSESPSPLATPPRV